MFTGIIEKVAPVLEVQKDQKGLWLSTSTGFKDLTLGESIAVNGACLTVAEILNTDTARFFVSQETLAKTNLSALSPLSYVNLERALLPTTRLSGHWVQGHVDTTVRLLKTTPIQNDCFEMEFEIPVTFKKYLVPKGSITLNGVSLTVNQVLPFSDETSIFTVMIIPHTWKNTNLSRLRATLGAEDRVNLEIDVLAKYVEQLCQH